MNSVVWLLMAACIAEIHAAPSLPPLPVNPGGIGGLFRGPNQETIIRGPDGSEITSEHLGGAVQTEARLEPIIVPDQIEVSSGTVSPEVISVSNNIGVPSATQVVTISENSAPSLQFSQVPQQVPIDISTATVQVSAAPTLVATAQEPHIIETELVDAPEIEPNQSSDLKGPSGSISVRGSSSIVSGPASTTISEPVRRIPVAVVPIEPPPVAIPSSVLIPPTPTAIDGFQSNVAQTSINLPSTHVSNNHVPLAYNDQHISPYLHTELVPPPLPPPGPPQPPNAQLPLNGITYTDASSPPAQTISSTAIPVDSLPPNAIDLGQTVVSTTQRSTIVPSNGDIDVRRINLGQTNTEQTSGISLGDLGLLSSSKSPQDGQNIVSSTSAPILSSTQISHQNVGVSLQQNAPLITTASDGSVQLPSIPTLSNSEPILNTNGLTGRIISQDQAILTNQIVPKINLNNNVNWISSTGVPSVERNSNVPSRTLVNIEQDHILHSTVAPPLRGGPISTVLDTVLVQPTDPRNREVIEFNGKQLENVGNIVPVIHHPVLVAGGLTHIQQIPTASISQLTSRHDLPDNNSYGR